MMNENSSVLFYKKEQLARGVGGAAARQRNLPRGGGGAAARQRMAALLFEKRSKNFHS
jgi:hypothetical protein